MTPGEAPRSRATPVAGRRALVVGLGTFGGGLGTARWLVAEGADVTVTDLRDEAVLATSVAALADSGVRLVLGRHREEDFAAAELVVVNPAVPPSSPWLARARARGAELTSELALFLERVPAEVVAVTGTQGKSSTAHMTHELLVHAGRRAHLGGNIGGSLLEALVSIEPADVVVLELSSYQLEALPASPAPARVRAVAWTNVLADHLERHGDVEAYRAAKLRLLELVRDGGLALVPADDRALADAVRARAGAAAVRTHGVTAEADVGVRAGRFFDGEAELGAVADLRLPGAFQVGNAVVALGLAHACGVGPAALAAGLPHLTGLRHRLEDLGVRAGVRVVDNGVSTTPDSTVAVLGDVPVGSTLLVGGEAKRLPLEGLARVAAERELLVVAFGAARERLGAALTAAGARTRTHATLEAAVRDALAATAPGGTLLFSPACASFDAYANFRARAEHFRALLPERDTPPQPPVTARGSAAGSPGLQP